MMITSGIKAQYTMGTTGMMNIPTAEMQQTGTFMIGGNYLPEELNPFKYNSGNYFVNITFFSFLELNYRCILLKSDYMAKKPKFNQQDRSLSVRLRPLKEGKYWPAIVIGSNDPFKDKFRIRIWSGHKKFHDRRTPAGSNRRILLSIK